MASCLKVVAHPSGPWLVSAGATMYATPPALARQVARWHGQSPSSAELRGCPPPGGVDPERWAAFMVLLDGSLRGQTSKSETRLPPPIWLRLPVLPAAVVGPVARWLSPLVSGWSLAGLALVGLVGYLHLGLTVGANPTVLSAGQVAVAMGLFLATAIWHEFGHAAALAYHGYPPGGIGTGLLFVFPVLFADVTAVGVLPRSGRLRVDVAGLVFQCGLGGVLCWIDLGVATLAAWLALAAVSWSLFPFVRSDGYWLICDLLGISELEVNPEPLPSAPVRWLLRLYRLANVGFLLLIGFYAPWRYSHLAESLWRRLGMNAVGTLVSVPLTVAGVLLCGVVWWGLGRRVVRLVRVL